MATPKILIIDDDPQLNQLVGTYLRRQGFEVNCAADGAQGLAATVANKPDLILCDLDMPTMDGQTVVAKLRQDENLGDIPVIFLSACTDRTQVRQTMNLGADDFLTKPAELLEIHDAIKARLSRHQQQRQRSVLQLKKAVEIFSGIVADLGSHTAGIQWLADAAAQRRLAAEQSASSPSGLGRCDLPNPPATPATSFLGKSANKKLFVKLSEVKIILADGEYSKVYWGKNQPMMFRKPLKQWIKELPDYHFVRVHRQAIINLNYLDCVEKQPDGKPQVRLRDYPDAIPVSQRCTPVLNRRLKSFRPAA